MKPYYYLTEAEERHDLEDLTCGSSCSHFDPLNLCCWLSWNTAAEGDTCKYRMMVDADGSHVMIRRRPVEKASGNVQVYPNE